jgi:hypothetical protein
MEAYARQNIGIPEGTTREKPVIRDFILFIRRLKAARDYDWRRVPPPEWAAKRSGVEYW